MSSTTAAGIVFQLLSSDGMTGLRHSSQLPTLGPPPSLSQRKRSYLSTQPSLPPSSALLPGCLFY